VRIVSTLCLAALTLALTLVALCVLCKPEDFAQAITLAMGSDPGSRPLLSLASGFGFPDFSSSTGRTDAVLTEGLLRALRASEITREKVALLCSLLEVRFWRLTQLLPVLLFGLFAAGVDGASLRKNASEAFGAFLPKLCSGAVALMIWGVALSIALLAVPCRWIGVALTLTYVAELVLIALAIRHFHRFSA